MPPPPDARGDVRVAIVGGGPAGLACALELKHRNPALRVTVFDRTTPPIDKACGEGLMPDGVERLAELGVDPADLGGMPFRGIRWLDDLAERPLEVDGAFPGASGLGVRRLDLHRALVAAAESAGVDLCWGRKVEGLEAPDATGRSCLRLVGGETVAARWVVAADGLRSPIRRQLGLAPRPAVDAITPPERFGVRRHYRRPPWGDRVEVHWGHEAEAYVTPVGDDEVGVAILWSGRKASFDQLLEGMPRLRERLAGADAGSDDRGMGPLRQRVLGVVSANVALVGDAAGYVDAITGEGLSVALHQARALAVSIVEKGGLADYAKRCRGLDRTARWLTHLLLFLERRPTLRRRVFRALERDPALFERFLAVHVRQARLAGLLPLTPRIGWRLLTA